MHSYAATLAAITAVMALGACSPKTEEPTTAPAQLEVPSNAVQGLEPTPEPASPAPAAPEATGTEATTEPAAEPAPATTP